MTAARPPHKPGPEPDPAAARGLRAWCQPGAEPDRADLLAAVRFTLAELARRIPGRSVEVRVPPAGAVQVLETGAKHRRGTPPAVVELNMDTWLALAVGRLTWAEADEDGRIDASGQLADLSPYLPLPGAIRLCDGKPGNG